MEKYLPWLVVLLGASAWLAACSPGGATPAAQPVQSAAPAIPTPSLQITPSQELLDTPGPVALNTPGAAPVPNGETRQEAFPSRLLKRDFHYYIYLPPGYESSGLAYPVVYLLHGRGENMAAWARIPRDLEPRFASGELAPFIAVMPDFPSQSGAGYYIDSQYTGADSPGEAVESAFFDELLPHIERSYRTIASREGRLVAGYSMGGYGALRYLLAHPQTFLAGIALSPAVYVPLPPPDSSTREFGAFGKGELKFDAAVYTGLNYEALFPSFSAAGLKSYLFIAVGDDEYMNPDPANASHDLDFEAHVLYNKARRVPELASELRVYDGAHTWEVWRRGFLEGLQFLSPYRAAPRQPP